jgi:murein DD-endopeptidase MepM/ murein hydrolase activator NlpD
VSVVAVLALLFVAGSASPAGGRAGGAASSAFAVRVVLPGQAAITSGEASAPPQAVLSAPGFQYPAADGSVVTSGALGASASATAGPDAASSAASDLSQVMLFNGEIVATAISARARASVGSGKAQGDVAGSGFVGLVVLGTPLDATTPNQRVELADWGYALLLEQSGVPAAGTGYSGFVTALDVHLTRDHGGLPAGSEILVGGADASAEVATPAPAPAPKPRARKAPAPAPDALPLIPPAYRAIPTIVPLLGQGGYVFPVWGAAGFSDTFGAKRTLTWHHGDDIFAPFGAPALAVADGVVFSVGWNKVGGNRLWLVDARGNEFYYAHLSAYAPVAVNGAQVRAGAVLGFVGNTGDARGTPFHLHFEIHPTALLSLGYDGAVDPTSYLRSWRHLGDLSAFAGSAYAPLALTSAAAPEPGAVLLQATDISSGNGLEPASLLRAFAPLSRAGEVALLAGAKLPVAPGSVPPPPTTGAAGGHD